MCTSPFETTDKKFYFYLMAIDNNHIAGELKWKYQMKLLFYVYKNLNKSQVVAYLDTFFRKT